jgi:hypothetical protein
LRPGNFGPNAAGSYRSLNIHLGLIQIFTVIL